MDALRLKATPDVWHRYQRSALPEHRSWEPLVRAWDRAGRAGASIEGPPPGERVLDDASLRPHRESCEVLLVEGREALDHAARAFAERDHVLLLADASGVVTHTAGGGGFEAEAARLRLVPGAAWSEAMRGTNAIGTVLAEGRAVSVEGAGHFGRRYHDLVCYAAPIVAPDGRVLGVLDATSHRANADDTLGAAVSAAARALEVVLKARAWAGAGAAARGLVERVLDRLPGFGMVVEPPGRIVRCNPAARTWMGPQALPVSLAELVGVSWETLVREALNPTRTLVVGTGRRALSLRAEPVLDAGGSLLAVAVFGESASAHTVAVRATPAPRPVPADPFAQVFAEDAAVLRSIAFARRVAASDLAVVLLSETGSGKELFANAMHAASPRAGGPFVPVNCGSLSPQLLESELFGYGPGAFTGAGKHGRDGLFHAANGGTLFLDEVAEMQPSMQTALLRVLESGTYTRVGETSPRRVDVRILCATCRDLPALVESGDFRKDLYYRLKSVSVTIPPLRERSDVLALVAHLLGDDAPPLSAALVRWIEGYGWPGNVRELKSVLAVVRLLGAESAELGVEHLPPDLPHPTGLDAALDPAVLASPRDSLAGVEVWAVKRALEQVGGNVSAAARRLGVARSTIYRILRRED
ncbi:MAG: sigma-54-dependent Fis family transcriptional regulator [Myxococcota bacterium]